MSRFAALLVVVLAAAAGAVVAGPAEVRLLQGWREADGRHVAAVEIALPQGWHTYWRVPGASGIPPRFDWTGSRNLARARVEWPHPEVFESFGTRTIGYHDRVVLPLILEPEDAAAPIDLALALSFGVCKDICIPAERALAEHLPAWGEAGRAPIEAALSRRASGAAEGGVLDATCQLAPNGRGMELAATVRLRAAPADAPVTVIEASARPDLWIGEARAHTRGALVMAAAPVEGAGRSSVIDRSALRLTLIGPARFVEIDGCRAPD